MRRALFIHGEKAWNAAQPFISEFCTVQPYYRSYKGECSFEEVRRLHDDAQSLQVDVIIGVGGGKVLDLAKAVGNETNIDVILIQTIKLPYSLKTLGLSPNDEKPRP